MIQESLKVEEMTCQHCIETITDALNDESGVFKVGIDIDKKRVKIDYDKKKNQLGSNFQQNCGVRF